MPKKTTPDSELKSEFAELKRIAVDERKARKNHEQIIAKRRKFVHQLATKKNASPTSMARVLDVSRQVVVKDIASIRKEAEARKAARASGAKAAKRVVRKKAAV
jgi:hypothetical protein